VNMTLLRWGRLGNMPEARNEVLDSNWKGTLKLVPSHIETPHQWSPEKREKGKRNDIRAQRPIQREKKREKLNSTQEKVANRLKNWRGPQDIGIFGLLQGGKRKAERLSAAWGGCKVFRKEASHADSKGGRSCC